MAESIEIAPEMAWLRTSISNVYCIGNAASWVLVDAGVVGYTPLIAQAAAARFGAGSRPVAIVLTHGHYDHVGCALDLAALWDVPVYAHPLEFPYLKGASAYPRKDPTVGGAMGFLSRFFPSRTVRMPDILRALPADGTVPGAPGWTALHTPGHAPGHVCFWRAADRVLIAGDVVATADLDSWRGILTQKKQISRPPAPFTYDWERAAESVRTMAGLHPTVLACGHGDPMIGDSLAADLERFASGFTPPRTGRYAQVPARADAEGVAWEPPAPKDNLPKLAAGLVAGVFLVAGTVYRKRGRKGKQELG